MDNTQKPKTLKLQRFLELSEHMQQIYLTRLADAICSNRTYMIDMYQEELEFYTTTSHLLKTQLASQTLNQLQK